MNFIKRIGLFAFAFILFFASVPFIAEASGTIKTDLVDGLVTKSEKLTFDLWAKDSNGTKLSGDAVTVKNNGQNVAINWDDLEKTSYTLILNIGKNTVNISAGSTNATYTITREYATDGEIIGHYTFSLDAFALGLGYIIEPVELPIIKGRNAAEELDAILMKNGFTYASTGTLKTGFYLSKIFKYDLFNKAVTIPNELKTKLNGVYDESDYSPATGLGEFDVNYMSGWMYSVNNTFPNVGFSDRYLLDGDAMRVQFTLAYGQDIGGGNAMGGGIGGDYFTKVNKDELTRKVATINTNGKSSYLINATRINAYKNALQMLQKIDASQNELTSALAQLQLADSAGAADGSNFTEDSSGTIPSTNSGNSKDLNEKQNANRVTSQIQIMPHSSDLTVAEALTVSLARQAYDALSPTAKVYVTNYSKLTEAEQVIQKLQASNSATSDKTTQAVIDQITQLPTTITLAHDGVIKKIRQAYDALSNSQKLLISNYSTLLLAEINLKNLSSSTGDPIKKVEQLIATLPSKITSAQLANVQSIEKAYYTLTSEQQEKVSNKATLLSAVAALQSLNEMIISKDGNITIPTGKLLFSMKITAEKLQEIFNNNAIHIITIQHSDDTKLILDKALLQKALNKQDLTIDLETITIGQTKELVVSLVGSKDIQIPLQIELPTSKWSNGYLVKKVGTGFEAVPHFEEKDTIIASIQSNTVYSYTTKQVSFTDLASNTNNDEISYLANRYVIQGSNGQFNPNHSITRAEFATMIARAIGAKATTISNFTDTKGKYYEESVQALFELGIISGQTMTTFNPNSPLNRQHAALMMARVLRYAKLEQPSTFTLPYKDAAKINKDYAADIAWLNELNIMSGSNELFSPTNNLTRAQMAKILKRSLTTAKIM